MELEVLPGMPTVLTVMRYHCTGRPGTNMRRRWNFDRAHEECL